MQTNEQASKQVYYPAVSLIGHKTAKILITLTQTRMQAGVTLDSAGYSTSNILLARCSVCRDARCGKIQCQGGANRPVIGTNAVSIETNIPLQEGGRILCRGTHVYLGDDMPDPGLVLTGTKCGDGMVGLQTSVGFGYLRREFNLVTFCLQ